MKNLAIVIGLAVTLAGCARSDSTPPVGTDVTVEKKDGLKVAGKLVDVKPEHVVVEAPDGVKTEVEKSQIAEVKPAPALAARRDAEAKAAAGAEPKTATGNAEKAPAAPVAPEPPSAPKPKEEATEPAVKRPEYREVTIPSGTTLSATLGTALASDTSKVEDPVRATLKTAVTADGLQAVPAGTTLTGHVTSAERSAKVKGLASIAFRFNTIDLPGEGNQPITTATISHVAHSTKKKDATKIGIGAGAGAVIGGIVGGGGGAAKGAAIGGGAGTAAVLATRGDEVQLAAGTPLSIKLTAPLTVRVPLK
jgi:hypothetical protein